jgi:hydroxypyruvate reductase
MMAAADRLRADCAAIRSAAVAAVDPGRLVAARLAVDSGRLLLDGRPFDPPVDCAAVGRIVVVGAGKAAAGMAAGVEAVLGVERLVRHRATGLVSVPEEAAAGPALIEARATRPVGENLPTAAVVAATREMLDLVAGLGPDDLAIVVISGGGSALLAAPREGVTLDEKIALTRRLSASGADIAALNAARRELSAVKGGGLARACGAGRLLAVVLSDVIGDDLEVIASGPCMPGVPTAPPGSWTTPRGCVVRHVIVGSSATAVDAAARAARDLGYLVRVRQAAPATPTEAAADEVGARLAAEALALDAESRRDGRPRAAIEGGEATVSLPADHGTGGRNQQTVVAALEAVLARGAWPEGMLVASVGTDGEDGPTAAAGGCADAGVAAAIAAAGLDLARARVRRDAHPLLAGAGGLLVTGPTGTNVCDVRIILARP